jgi:hypothetical protein
MNLGRLFISAGLILLVAGVIIIGLSKLNLPVGRLPGDIVWRGRNTTFYFPWVTCLLLSLLGSVVLWLISRR